MNKRRLFDQEDLDIDNSTSTDPGACGGVLQTARAGERKVAGVSADPNLHCKSDVLRMLFPNTNTAVPPSVRPEFGFNPKRVASSTKRKLYLCPFSMSCPFLVSMNGTSPTECRGATHCNISLEITVAGIEVDKLPKMHFHLGKLEMLSGKIFTVTKVCPLEAGAIEG